MCKYHCKNYDLIKLLKGSLVGKLGLNMNFKENLQNFLMIYRLSNNNHIY